MAKLLFGRARSISASSSMPPFSWWRNIYRNFHRRGREKEQGRNRSFRKSAEGKMGRRLDALAG